MKTPGENHESVADSALGWTLLSIGISAAFILLLSWLVWSSLPKTLVLLRMPALEAFRLVSRKLALRSWKLKLDGPRLSIDVERDAFVAVRVRMRPRMDGWTEVRFSAATTGGTLALSLIGEGVAGLISEVEARKFARNEVLAAIVKGLPPAEDGSRR